MAACSLLLLTAVGRAQVPDFEFHAPPSPADPSTPGVMRDLAERIIPNYQDPDRDRYLSDLSVLQLVAGNAEAADASRQELLDRHQGEEPQHHVGWSVTYDIYAHARAMEVAHRTDFATSFSTTFRQVVPKLNNLEAFAVTARLATPPAVVAEGLQSSFDRLRPHDRISQPEAMQLLNLYLAYEAYRRFSPLVGLLEAEDDRHRYTADLDIDLKLPRGIHLSVTVVRPGGDAKPAPTLLEFGMDDAFAGQPPGASAGGANGTREDAAHGYVGVFAYVRRASDKGPPWVPFEHDGERVRALIDWITRQPWSDGRVALVGSGYSGFTAWAAAKKMPPAVKAIATFAPMAPGIDFPMAGAIPRNSAFRWSLPFASGGPAEPATMDEAAQHALDLKWYASGRRYRDLAKLYGTPNPLFVRWLNHPSYDRYWQKMLPFQKEFAHLGIPTLTASGYYATDQAAALYYLSQSLHYDPHGGHTLVIGPYDEAGLERSAPAILRKYRLDASAVIDWRELRFQWLDHVLRDAAAPPLLTDHVNYEVMGANEWRHAPGLEAMATGTLRFYLDAGTGADRHALTTTRAPRGKPVLQTVVLRDRGDAAAANAMPSDLVVTSPEVRDATVFVSRPLTKPVTLSGLLAGHLDLTVNKMDVDLSISLFERLANGDTLRLFSPSYAFRASYARDRGHRRLLQAGVRQDVAFIGERVLSRRLQAGSRVVLVLGVVKRPDREINYGTGGDVGEESIADGRTPLKLQWQGGSYLDLPVRK